MRYIKGPRLLGGLVVAAVALMPTLAAAQITVYHDRAAFTTAVNALDVVLTDDFESYALGPIPLGGRRGDFLYSFDPNITQPAIVPGGNDGQALGGSPFDVFVGGDSVSLGYSPLVTGRPLVLRAFGADFLYAPSFEDIPADIYRLCLLDGAAAGQCAGNLDGLDGVGGTFFLGIITGQAQAFNNVSLLSVQLDPEFLVPAYQADNLIYAGVPEPGALSLFTLGGILLFTRLRRRR